jgi:HK97 family phage portal protein
MQPFTVSGDAAMWESWPLRRDEAWCVPAVAQGLQVIAGTVGTLPPERVRGRTPLPLPTVLRQPDPEEPREATFVRIVEDLVLFPEAFAVVLERDAEGFPARFRYVPHETVEPFDWVDPLDPYAAPTRRYRIDQHIVLARDVLRFPSHWPGLLVVGGRALRTSILLERAAARFSQVEIPPGYIKNNGPDLDDTKITELLDRWSDARATRQTGYLNALLEFVTPSFDPTQLQLVEARRWQTTEVGRLLNLPSRYLNAQSESSMTYSNIEQEKRDLIDLSLRPYVRALESRLAMDDVCPRGQTVRLDLDDFYRGDMATLGAYYTAALAGGWMTIDEVRAANGDPPIGEVPVAAT